MAEVEQLKLRKAQLEKMPVKIEPIPGVNERGQKERELRVCDICGSFISIRDNDQRLQDHFAGKLHIGYTVIRDRMEEINQNRRNAPPRSCECSLVRSFLC